MTYNAYRAVDVSAHQGIIDWARVRKAGYRVAIIRVGICTTIDARLYQNLSAARNAGMLIGAYCVPYVVTVKNVTVSTLCSDAVRNADICAKWLDGYKLDLPVFIDWEYAQDSCFYENSGLNLTVSGRTQFILAVADRLKQKGYTPGIYTNPDYLIGKLTPNAFKTYPLFLAKYVKEGTAAKAADVPQTYGFPMLWQWEKGRIPGCDTEIDLDWYYIPQK